MQRAPAYLVHHIENVVRDAARLIGRPLRACELDALLLGLSRGRLSRGQVLGARLLFHRAWHDVEARYSMEKVSEAAIVASSSCRRVIAARMGESNIAVLHVCPTAPRGDDALRQVATVMLSPWRRPGAMHLCAIPLEAGGGEGSDAACWVAIGTEGGLRIVPAGPPPFRQAPPMAPAVMGPVVGMWFQPHPRALVTIELASGYPQVRTRPASTGFRPTEPPRPAALGWHMPHAHGEHAQRVAICEAPWTFFVETEGGDVVLRRGAVQCEAPPRSPSPPPDVRPQRGAI